MVYRVVVVDDAAFIREVFSHLLKSAGYDVVGEAADGEEAVSLACQLKPDLILMDIVMPRKSGIQAAIEIKALFPKIKIVACSTEGSESMVVKALESGCCDYIVKPFQTQQVLHVLEKALFDKTA